MTPSFKEQLKEILWFILTPYRNWVRKRALKKIAKGLISLTTTPNRKWFSLEKLDAE